MSVVLILVVIMMSEYTASYFHKGAVTFWEHFGEKGELTDLNEPVCQLCLKRWQPKSGKNQTALLKNE